MPSGGESDASDVVSEFETQFVERPGDEDILWAVQEITAERGNKYKVKWVGVDPATGKPWAQSWVAKHDCTNDLVVDWKKKKKRLGAEKSKRGSRASTASRTSGASKQTGPPTLGTKTRRSTSRATSSRLDSGERRDSPPPKQPTSKRKRSSEKPVTMPSDATRTDEQSESFRPRKKQRTMVEVLLPPISSEEDEDDLLAPIAHAKGAPRNRVPLTSRRDSGDVSDGDDSSPPKAESKSVRRLDARPEGNAVSSRVLEVRVPHFGIGTKVTPRRKKRVTNNIILSAESEEEDEQLRPPRSQKVLRRKSPSVQQDDLSEKEGKSTAHPVKTRPPRGIKRQEMSRKPGAPSEPGPSRAKPRDDDPVGERVSAEGSTGHHDHEVSSFGSPLLLRESPMDSHVTPPQHTSIPQVPSGARPRSPDLSPGTKARLELFDRMVMDSSEPDAILPPDASEHVPDDSHFSRDGAHDTYDAPDTFEPPLPLSPPPSKSKPEHSKPGTANGLIVPETESSGNSQSQSQPQLALEQPQPPQAHDQSARKPTDLPTIAVIAASATSSSISPQDPFPPQKLPPSTNHPSKRPIFEIAPSTFRSTTVSRSPVADSEAPPSSIESFASPKRVDKGKQRAVEDGQPRRSLSADVDSKRQKGRTRWKITDSELKKRGKELFDLAQRTQEAERRKDKKTKRLKTIDEIVNGTVSSPSKGPPSLFASGAESALGLQLEDVIDLSGGANSTTLDTPEHSEARPLSEEERERLRIELREEEEESTQEAMGIYLPPPVNGVEGMNCGNAQMPPPASSEIPPPSEHIEDLGHVEQPSTDLLQASVIVQASQEPRHEDTDIEPMPVNQPTSSPARPVPDNLTDSPKRRLGEALSLLNVKSEEIERLERELADERKTLRGLKVELAELQRSMEPTGSVCAAWEAERAQWTEERSKWENDLSAWETQRKEMSEEMTSLSARLAELSDVEVRAEEARVKLSELEVERAAWTRERDVMLNDMAQRSEEPAVLSNLRGEYDQDRLKWEAEKAQWAEERARWETERATLQEKQETLLRSVKELTASTESTRAGKISAEMDRDFFRGQYAQASEFVDSVRKENVELEKRVKIAEGQAQEGVAGIKVLFEDRVKAMQADIDRWKGLTELLQEKDRRTNDELRLRAARVPELEELCDRLTTENDVLGSNLRKLGLAQQRSILLRGKLFYQILMLKKERASLRSKISKLGKMADSSTNTQESPLSALVLPILGDPESIDPNDIEILPNPTPQSLDISTDEPTLFPCMWRPEWKNQCHQVFDTKEDLERHMQEHFRDLLVQ